MSGIREEQTMKLRKTQGAGIALMTALLLGAGVTDAAQDKGMLKMPDFRPDYVKYDKNVDGAVTLDEYIAHEKTEQAFKDADANKDGRLNEDEFIKARAIDDRTRAAEFIDDAWITTKVKAMLLKDSGLAGLKVDVDTKDGVVTLSGHAESGQQIDQAVRIANGIKGVKEVRNELGTPGAMSDFRKADTNRDGYLSSKEGMDYVGTSLRLDEKAFKAADTDGDGRLSQAEFTRWVESTMAKPMVEPTEQPR
jgi:hyperosmotically inducible protein